MRCTIAALGLLLATQAAHAETVVVLSSQAELDGALRVAMAGRGIGVASARDPAGQLRFERAAIAQHAAVELGADAAVWVDEAEVCAITADGHEFRHAPFPSEVASPRAFAAIATSLLDEMMQPETLQGFDVDVDVNVTPVTGRPGRVAIADPAAAGPEPLIDAPGVVAEQPAPDQRAHEGHILLELGPMLSPVTVGLQGALAVPVSHAWRLAGAAAINMTFDGDYTIGVGSVELRHVGRGRTKHWDIGPEAGFATDGSDPVAFAGARIARTWEGADRAISLGFTPMLIKVLESSPDPLIFPAIYMSLRYQAPL